MLVFKVGFAPNEDLDVYSNEQKLTQKMTGARDRKQGTEYQSSGAVSAYKYSGKECDATGLYYFGKRYYDPYIGRWLSVDPMADKYPGLSPYNYCANNPLKYVDMAGDTLDIPEEVLNHAAFQWFASTRVGKNILKKYACAGQSIKIGEKSYTFSKDGKNSAEKVSVRLDLISDEGGTNKTGEHSYLITIDPLGNGKNAADTYLEEFQHVDIFINYGLTTAGEHHNKMLSSTRLYNEHLQFLEEIGCSESETYAFMYDLANRTGCVGMYKSEYKYSPKITDYIKKTYEFYMGNSNK